MYKHFVLPLSFTFSLSIAFGQNDPVKVYNFHNSMEMQQFRQINLDESHENLLNPEVSKNSINHVIESWSELHQAIGSHLEENKFEWGVEGESISILHRIYFEKRGKIKAHFFRLLSPELPIETTEEFAKHLATFGETYRLDITRSNDYAQCGKTRYAVGN